LIESARDDLADSDQEAFKVLLLSAMVGLRRKEIDLLPWSAFRWNEGIIRVEHTRHFTPKTDDSAADVAVDPELMSVFRGYHVRAPKAEFVIVSESAPRAGVLYNFYRCEQVFERLTVWLREHGIRSAKPIHELRKAFGSLICQKAGLHQASVSLRHCDIRTTSAVYVDSRSRIAAGLGHLGCRFHCERRVIRREPCSIGCVFRGTPLSRYPRREAALSRET
jgi:integrase